MNGVRDILIINIYRTETRILKVFIYLIVLLIREEKIISNPISLNLKIHGHGYDERQLLKKGPLS